MPNVNLNPLEFYNLEREGEEVKKLLGKIEGVEDGANNYRHPTGDGNCHVPPIATIPDKYVLMVYSGEAKWRKISFEDIDGLGDYLALKDAMVFKGVIGGINDLANILSSNDWSAGWTWRMGLTEVEDNLYYRSPPVEVGDVFIAIKDAPITALAQGSEGINDYFAVIQANIDGAVTSEESTSEDGDIPVFSGTNGRVVKSSHKKMEDFEQTINKNATGGYAGLDENGKLFEEQIPDEITEMFTSSATLEEIKLTKKDGVSVTSDSEAISAADYATELVAKGYVPPYLLVGAYNKTKVMVPKASEGGIFNEADGSCWHESMQSSNYYMAKVDVSSFVGKTIKIKGASLNTFLCPCAFVVDAKGNILQRYGTTASTVYGYTFPSDYIAAGWSVSEAIETTIPEGAVYLYVSGRLWTQSGVIKLDAVPVLEIVTLTKMFKEEYLPEDFAKKEDLHTHNNKDVLDAITKVPAIQDEVRFVLPPYMYFVVGKTTEIAPFSALRRATANSVDRMIVYTSGGEIAQYAEQVAHVTESADTIGSYFTLKAYITGEKKEMTVKNRVSAADAGNGSSIKLLFIGDSLMASHTTDTSGKSVSSVITRTLSEDFAEDEITVTFLGTQGSEGYKHEGRSSWSAYSFVNEDIYTNLQNPFRNEGKFNFEYYMSSQGYDGVDVVIFNLGVNDLSNRRTSAQLIADLNTMIASIHAFDANIKVIITLQNICSDWVTHTKKAYDGRRDALHDNIEALIEAFQYKESSGIYLAPVYTAVNSLWDMQYGSYAIENSRNPEILTVGTDMTHPNYYGYQKMADVYYAVIKYLLSL